MSHTSCEAAHLFSGSIRTRLSFSSEGSFFRRPESTQHCGFRERWGHVTHHYKDHLLQSGLFFIWEGYFSLSLCLSVFQFLFFIFYFHVRIVQFHLLNQTEANNKLCDCCGALSNSVPVSAHCVELPESRSGSSWAEPVQPPRCQWHAEAHMTLQRSYTVCLCGAVF